MVALDISETSKALAVAGGYVSVIGLVSYFVKEKLFMSEALIATIIGIITGPIALNWFNPLGWSSDPNYLTHEITRIIIAIQVLFTGIALPAAYVKKEWKSLATLLGPVMTIAWFVSGLLIWGLIPGLTFLESLVIGSCVTPTDPVLANSICKGRFAEKHVPLHVRNIILAESGANDGLGFPFLFIGLYLILIHEASHPWHTVGGAVGEWFYNIVLYQVTLSCIIGVIIGYVARKVLKFARRKQLIDHESFLSFGVALTFVTLGIVGLIGSDDILCCFVVGNSFTWDDWFRLETEEHDFQDVIDQLLNSAIFLYIGAIIPWSDFNHFQITPWRLVILGILVMLVRRLPWVIVLSRWIPSLCTMHESLFAGYFGPIGVGAVFYVQVALDVLPEDGTRQHLRDVILPVVYFLVLTSVVVHGVTIPLGKGFQRARTKTLTMTNSFSKSNTGGGGENVVSRLPPPVKPGQVEVEDGNAVRSERGEGTIRFDLDDTMSARENGTSSPRILSRRSSRAELRQSNLDHSSKGNRKDDDDTDADNMEMGDMSPNRRAHRDPDGFDRETREDRMRGETWREGRDLVIESNDGETRKVIRGPR
ncbi:hypothetical protein CI109_102241 [Kwoniella shandongensis]|uniref:Cation/H+ exchanger transmembrane domain-containing protein n=1 Tax=Kwoniella shandongensis TaxID=1734106 RepID=A0A5M6BZZ3_9TREE|nr:uncharacterized protein CI109_003605 [Kwoniella shandongensis]KAA5527951.1 hypothetical protein CI109_003605 [Kwoniella shandongensis]